MTAHISNEPTTTRLHHYAGRYSPVVGVLHDMKPPRGVPPACRTLMSCNSPNRVAVRPGLEVV